MPFDAVIGSPMAESYAQPSIALDCVVFDARGRLLLIRRKNAPFQGQFALPGGFMELGETTEEGARRELREETGIEAGPLRLVGVYSDPKRDPRRHTVSVVYLGDSLGGEPRASDDAAHAEFVSDWKSKPLAFDHEVIVRDALVLRAKR